MARSCGLKGCVQNAVPGAYIEGNVFLGSGQWQPVRIEVCASHYDLLSGDEVGLSVVPEATEAATA